MKPIDTRFTHKSGLIQIITEIMNSGDPAPLNALREELKNRIGMHSWRGNSIASARALIDATENLMLGIKPMPKMTFADPCTRTVEEFIEFFNGLFSETALRRIFQTYANWLSDDAPLLVSSDELRDSWMETHPSHVWGLFDGLNKKSIKKSGDRILYDLAALNKITIAIDTGGCDVAGKTETRVLVMR